MPYDFSANPNSPEYYQQLMQAFQTRLAERRRQAGSRLSENLGARGLYDSGQIPEGEQALTGQQLGQEGDYYAQLLGQQKQGADQIAAEKRDEERQRRLLQFQANLAKRRGMTRGQRALTGAVSGAGTGAGVGAFSANPFGIAIGAGVGAIGGGLAGYFYGDE